MRARRLRPGRRALALLALAGSGAASTAAASALAAATAPDAEVTSAASPPLRTEPEAAARRWSRPYVTATFVYNGLYGAGAALEAMPSPHWAIGLELVSSRLGPFLTGRLHFLPELRRGGRHHQFLLGLGGDVGLTPSSAAGGLAAWVAPTLDLRYLGRPHPSFGVTLGTRCGAGFSWEARDLTRARKPSTPLDHLALVLVTYVGLSFGHHTRR